jgi:hypothetical protein
MYVYWSARPYILVHYLFSLRIDVPIHACMHARSFTCMAFFAAESWWTFCLTRALYSANSPNCRIQGINSFDVYACVCISVYMYVCIHLCMYVCMYVCMYAFSKVSDVILTWRKNEKLSEERHIHVTALHVYVHTYKYKYKYITCMYACIYIYIIRKHDDSYLLHHTHKHT